MRSTLAALAYHSPKSSPTRATMRFCSTTAFAVLLISFMLFVSFHDIKRIGLFKALLQQENQIEPSGKAAPAPAQ